MEKKEITFNLSHCCGREVVPGLTHSVNWDEGETIEKILSDLRELHECGVNMAIIKNPLFFITRLETDEEFLEREKKHKEWLAKMEQNERAQYEKLKLKYG